MDNNKPKQYTTKQLVESIGVSRQQMKIRLIEVE